MTEANNVHGPLRVWRRHKPPRFGRRDDPEYSEPRPWFVHALPSPEPARNRARGRPEPWQALPGFAWPQESLRRHPRAHPRSRGSGTLPPRPPRAPDRRPRDEKRRGMHALAGSNAWRGLRSAWSPESPGRAIAPPPVRKTNARPGNTIHLRAVPRDLHRRKVILGEIPIHRLQVLAVDPGAPFPRFRRLKSDAGAGVNLEPPIEAREAGRTPGMFKRQVQPLGSSTKSAGSGPFRPHAERSNCVCYHSNGTFGGSRCPGWIGDAPGVEPPIAAGLEVWDALEPFRFRENAPPAPKEICASRTRGPRAVERRSTSDAERS